MKANYGKDESTVTERKLVCGTVISAALVIILKRAKVVKYQTLKYVIVVDNGDLIINNNNRRLVTLAEHTSDHGKQTQAHKKRGSRARKLLVIYCNTKKGPSHHCCHLGNETK